MPKEKRRHSFAVAISRAWGTRENPPVEFRLFSMGANRTTKGLFHLDAEHAQGCVNKWKALGRPLSGDYNHGAAYFTPEPVPACCTFGLEARGDGLWAVNVDWTDRARSLLKAGEYRYFSPYFDVEITSSGKRWVREIYNFALTNDPATIGQTPLILSRGEKPMKEALFAAIRDLLAATLPPEQAAALAASILELPEIVALVPVEEAPETEAPESEAAPEAPAAELPAQMQEALTKLLSRTENLEKAVSALAKARQALSGAKPAQSPARKAETPEAVFDRVLLAEKRAGKSESEARLAAFTAARAVKK